MLDSFDFDKFFNENRFFREPEGRIGALIWQDSLYADIMLIGDKEETAYQRNQLTELKKDEKLREKIRTIVMLYQL